MQITYIDPPEGWKYGFPRLLPECVKGSGAALATWLEEQGYPRELLGVALQYSRYWTEEIEDAGTARTVERDKIKGGV